MTADKQKLFLVTNDDGIEAGGLNALIELVRPYGRVMVVAPEDWPAFLASESAMALASASVRPGTRELFSAQGRARWLGNLLRGLA